MLAIWRTWRGVVFVIIAGVPEGEGVFSRASDLAEVLACVGACSA